MNMFFLSGSIIGWIVLALCWNNYDNRWPMIIWSGFCTIMVCLRWGVVKK